MTRLSRQCVILVGGLGSRLGAITAHLPKPLLEVAGRPFLEHLMLNAQRFGFDDFLLLAGHNAQKVMDFAETIQKTLNVSVRVVVEPKAAGTAGALLNARSLLEEEFLMMNGDSLFDFNLLDLATQTSPGVWLARVAVRRTDYAGRYGTVEIEGDHIHGFKEKSQDHTTGLINGGVYWLKRGVIDYIATPPCSLEHNVFPFLAARGLMRGSCYDGSFIDIGVPEDLSRARAQWTELLRRPAVFFDRDGVLNHDAGYTHRIEDFRWIDGAREAIRRCNDDGRYVFVITNQGGIARGFYHEADVRLIHAWMRDDLRASGAHIDDIRYCPHHPDGVLDEYSIVCGCRKPGADMLFSLLERWPVDISKSIVVGDKETDMAAAKLAGIKGLLFTSPQVFRLI